MIRITYPNKKILSNHRGAVAIVVALSLVVLLGFGAFAIDFGNAYVVKNELQNAADAAALAGASVLFQDNELCTSSSSPYDCCSGSQTGSCDPAKINTNNVTSSAQAVAAKNYSSGSQIPVPVVEVGHYSFAATRSEPGNFDPNPNIQNPTLPADQMTGWVTQSFSDLNTNNNFINAVRVTLTRTNVPRFLSRIWSSTPLSITVQSVAYVGFAGYLEPGAADMPIAICKQSITDASGNYTACNIGRMLNSGSNPATNNTAAWTNFSQPCETANKPSIDPLLCGEGAGKTCTCGGEGNPKPIAFGSGVGSTGGTDNVILKTLRDSCFQPATRTEPMNMTLPVVDCPGNNPGNCSTVVGVVNVDVVWISEKDADTEAKFEAENFPPSRMGDWVCDSSCAGSRVCCWDKFVEHFKLKNVDDATATYAQKSIYFLPSCTPHEPSGGTGGENYGVLARFPVLVNSLFEALGT